LGFAQQGRQGKERIVERGGGESADPTPKGKKLET